MVRVIQSITSKYLALPLALGLNAGYASNVVDEPANTSPLTVKRTVFSNKAFEMCPIKTDVKLIGVSKNSFGLVESNANASAEEFSPSIPDFGITVESVDRATDKVTIADAEIVVSGGRGLKGPENWGMIEELAEVLGAAIACCQPVSDLVCRPHS